MNLRRLALGTLLAAFDGRRPPAWTLDLAADGIAGYVLFKSNVDQLSTLTSQLLATRPDVLIAIDEEGGDVTRLWRRSGSPYPGNAALGVADDPELTRSIYRAIGRHLAAVGVNFDLAPVVDVNSVDDNPVIGTRSFGRSPSDVARHGAAAVTGLQEAGVAACAKHFPGHGATTVDSHLALPTVDAPSLEPFIATIDAGVRAVMTAHIRVPALTGAAPATFSPAAVRLLRTDLGFDGVIVTDALEMRGAMAFSGGIPAGAVMALGAGADLICLGARVDAELVEAVVTEIVDAVSEGRLPESRLVEANTRNAALRATLSQESALRTSTQDEVLQNATMKVGAAQGATTEGGAARSATSLGVGAAARAIVVEGALPELSRALVIQLDATTTIAEGRVAWGLVPHLVDGVMLAASPEAAAQVSERAGDAPIVIVGRNLHRLPGATGLIETLTESHDVVAVEMAWPTSWRPRNVRAFVTTHGSTRASGLAVAEKLGMITKDATVSR